VRAKICSSKININKHLKKVIARDGSSNNLDAVELCEES
jgi:hypothetical protein